MKLYYKHVGMTKFRSCGEFDSIIKARECVPSPSTSSFEIRDGQRVVWRNRPLNPNGRRSEPIRGQNLQILHQVVDRQHVSKSVLSIMRIIREDMKNYRDLPRPLRRGIIKAVCEKHRANRDLYNAVMSGRLG